MSQAAISSNFDSRHSIQPDNSFSLETGFLHYIYYFALFTNHSPRLDRGLQLHHHELEVNFLGPGMADTPLAQAHSLQISKSRCASTTSFPRVYNPIKFFWLEKPTSTFPLREGIAITHRFFETFLVSAAKFAQPDKRGHSFRWNFCEV
jgi:hypothetical protein